ncbi:unnamed protein product [Rotaria sp. Silwood1]|nr:unnamed protein product [Rotaria sp. Silwood1]CAF1583101.1 unnamed protein product [Rotaria sp. Silwood1]
MILYKHIKNVKTENEAKLLLADIQVRRDAGIFNWFTNISKNIWKLFTSINSSDLFRKKNCSQFQCWTDRMQEIFHQLHKYHIKENDYIKNMQEIPLTNGFLHLIIISNSNLVFINIILKYHHLYHNFKDIFTNPAYFNKNEQYLIIEQYGQQTCPSNMCK